MYGGQRYGRGGRGGRDRRGPRPPVREDGAMPHRAGGSGPPYYYPQSQSPPMSGFSRHEDGGPSPARQRAGTYGGDAEYYQGQGGGGGGDYREPRRYSSPGHSKMRVSTQDVRFSASKSRSDDFYKSPPSAPVPMRDRGYARDQDAERQRGFAREAERDFGGSGFRPPPFAESGGAPVRRGPPSRRQREEVGSRRDDRGAQHHYDERQQQDFGRVEGRRRRGATSGRRDAELAGRRESRDRQEDERPEAAAMREQRRVEKRDERREDRREDGGRGGRSVRGRRRGRAPAYLLKGSPQRRTKSEVSKPKYFEEEAEKRTDAVRVETDGIGRQRSGGRRDDRRREDAEAGSRGRGGRKRRGGRRRGRDRPRGGRQRQRQREHDEADDTVHRVEEEEEVVVKDKDKDKEVSAEMTSSPAPSGGRRKDRRRGRGRRERVYRRREQDSSAAEDDAGAGDKEHEHDDDHDDGGGVHDYDEDHHDEDLEHDDEDGDVLGDLVQRRGRKKKRHQRKKSFLEAHRRERSPSPRQHSDAHDLDDAAHAHGYEEDDVAHSGKDVAVVDTGDDEHEDVAEEKTAAVDAIDSHDDLDHGQRRGGDRRRRGGGRRWKRRGVDETEKNKSESETDEIEKKKKKKPKKAYRSLGGRLIWKKKTSSPSPALAAPLEEGKAATKIETISLETKAKKSVEVMTPLSVVDSATAKKENVAVIVDFDSAIVEGVLSPFKFVFGDFLLPLATCGGSLDAQLKEAFAKSGITRAAFEAKLAELPVATDAIALLKILKKLGVRLLVVSSGTCDEVVKLVLKLHGIDAAVIDQKQDIVSHSGYWTTTTLPTAAAAETEDVASPKTEQMDDSLLFGGDDYDENEEDKKVKEQAFGRLALTRNPVFDGAEKCEIANCKKEVLGAITRQLSASGLTYDRIVLVNDLSKPSACTCVVDALDAVSGAQLVTKRSDASSALKTKAAIDFYDASAPLTSLVSVFGPRATE